MSRCVDASVEPRAHSTAAAHFCGQMVRGSPVTAGCGQGLLPNKRLWGAGHRMRAGPRVRVLADQAWREALVRPAGDREEETCLGILTSCSSDLC